MYVKLFATILNSSLWSLTASTRILFITMLELADREGYVYGSIGGLARQANITREECEAGLRDLMSPDVDSSDLMRNPENEGRRVEVLHTGGWRVLNYCYYRNLRDDDTRREQNRLAQQAKRDREKARADSQQSSAGISTGQKKSAQSESESESERKEASEPAASDSPSSPSAAVKKHRPRKAFEDDSQAMKAARYLFDAIREHAPDFPQPKSWQSWARDFDLILRVDGRSAADVRAVIDFATRDNFWRSQTLSPGALRGKTRAGADKFEYLLVQLKKAAAVRVGRDSDHEECIGRPAAW